MRNTRLVTGGLRAEKISQRRTVAGFHSSHQTATNRKPMTEKLPDYTTVEPPDDKLPEEYTTHERRADILQAIIEVGEPSAVNQRALSARYKVHESTVSRDMDRLRESINEHLGTDAKFTTRTLYQHVVRELLSEDDWRATKAAWDVAQEWNEWLAEIGEQHREPKRSEVDVDVRSREVAYELVRDNHGDPLPTTDKGDVDYEKLGFTSVPIESESSEAIDDD